MKYKKEFISLKFSILGLFFLVIILDSAANPLVPIATQGLSQLSVPYFRKATIIISKITFLLLPLNPKKCTGYQKLFFKCILQIVKLANIIRMPP